jgi:serine phosphatase RsbU (regulator of sigma subunit)
MTDEDPAEVLNRLNDALLSGWAVGADDERFCTALLAIVSPFTSGDEVGATIRLANGGHPYPLLLQPGGKGEVRVDGSLLGVLEEPVIVTSELILRQGDSLVLYTDGVLDTLGPDSKERFGEERLMQAATGATAEEIVESIREAVLGFGGDRLNDDVAVLAVSVD